MLITLIFIKINNLNIFFKLLKITLIVNDLKLNESLNMLMKLSLCFPDFACKTTFSPDSIGSVPLALNPEHVKPDP